MVRAPAWDAPGEVPPQGSLPAQRRQRILVVDDEPDILESLRDVLEACDPHVEVVGARSGFEALGLLRSAPFDLLLTDYKMPRMDGLDLAREVRASHPDLPVVLLTAFPDLDLAIHSINEGGVEHFLTKPFAPGAVSEVVRALLRDAKARDQRSRTFDRARATLEQRQDALRGGPVGASS
jgi:DNA-binding response OmpR family regulator